MKPATPAPSVGPGRSVDEPSDHSLRAGPWGDTELKFARTPDLDHVFRDEHANLRMTVETVAGASFRPNRPREPPELVPKAADVDVDGSVDRRSAIPPNVA